MSSAPQRAGPAVLLLPVLALVLAVLWIARFQELSAPPPFAPEGVERDGLQGAWLGEQELPERGGRLEARLTRLHVSERRQGFDREVLVRRMGLGDGEPWLLELNWVEVDSPPRPGAGIALAAVRVDDANGSALAVLSGASAGAAPDPLGTLLSTPAEPLAPGEAVELLLWGRAPGGAARLRGLTPLEDGAPTWELALTPTEVRAPDLPRSLARLDASSATAADVPPDGNVSAEGDLREDSNRKTVR